MANPSLKFKLSPEGEAHLKNPKTKGILIKGGKQINLRVATQAELSFLYGENGSVYVELDLKSPPSEPSKK